MNPMTKKFELTKGVEQDEKRFEFLYEGFIIGGTLVQSKGLPVLRRELAILDKLMNISKDCECGKKIIQDETKRELLEGTQTFEFDRMEYELVNQYIGSVPWSTGKSLRNALETIDWLQALP
jgi:hypothetical protein